LAPGFASNYPVPYSQESQPMALRNRWIPVAAALLAGMVGCSDGASRVPPEAVNFEIDRHGPTIIRCLMWLPKGYRDTTRQWPLVLFLHGAGERGSDLEAVKKHGLPRVLEEGRQFAFVVVAPQCERHGWNPGELIQLVDQVAASYSIDRERIYVTGLSMGGFGTWAFVAAHPDRFAAAVPICGGGDPRWADRLKSLPIWGFHGARDDVVPLAHLEEMVGALKSAGSDVRFTVYPNAGHDCWTETYQNPRLYE
jgi:predicted peptidase